MPRWLDGNPPRNVWLGATICDQAEADRDVSRLLAVPARVRFLSIEPMLGPINVRWAFPDIRTACCHRCGFRTNRVSGVCPNDGEVLRSDIGINWVICGGESGPHARPMHPDWVRSLRDQCAEAGVPFLFKQWGNWRAAAWFDGPQADAGEEDDFVDHDRTEHVFLANDGREWGTMGGRYMYPPMPLGHWCLMVREPKERTGRVLDGRTYDEFPSEKAR